MLSQIQEAEMEFSRWVQGMTLRDNVRSGEIRKTVNVEPCDQNVPGRIRGKSCWLLPQPRGRQGTRWSNYISTLGWSRRGVEPAALSAVAENPELFRVLGLIPHDPPQSGNEMRKSGNENEWMVKIYPGNDYNVKRLTSFVRTEYHFWLLSIW